MKEIYSDWAKALQDCSVGGIEYAVNQCRLEAHPPNLGEFLACCAKYVPPSNVLYLEKKYDPASWEKGRQRIHEIAEMLARKKVMQ